MKMLTFKFIKAVKFNQLTLDMLNYIKVQVKVIHNLFFTPFNKGIKDSPAIQLSLEKGLIKV